MILQIKWKGDVFYFNMGVRHVRNYKVEYDENGVEVGRIIKTKGGMTIVSVTSLDEHNTIPRIYPSRCHENDNFNPRMGIVYGIQDLIWDVISPTAVMYDISFSNKGNTMLVETNTELEDPVGEFNYNLKSLCKHNPLAVL